jgi:hypothetical protein
MITKTSINTTVILKLLKAFREAQKHGIAHVRNRKGNAFLAVRKFIVNGKVFFQVLDKHGNNVKRLITSMVCSFMNADIVSHNVAGLLVDRLAYPFQLGQRA